MSSKNEGNHLDTHTNMMVCGKYCHVLSRLGINDAISAFCDNTGTMQIPIINDVIVYYDCPDKNNV